MNSLNNYFDIKYIPDDNFCTSFLYLDLPLNAEITLGKIKLGVNETIYQSVGRFFFPSSYMDAVESIFQGKQETIVLHERHPVPLTFKPKGKKCVIKLEKDSIGDYVSFDKKKVHTQIVDLEETVFKLTNFMSEFLYDMEAKNGYFLLDELELEIKEYFENPQMKKLFEKKGEKLYEFKYDQSTQRVMDAFKTKKKAHDNYEDFVETLTARQKRDWDLILFGLKQLFPDKDEEQLYQLFEPIVDEKSLKGS